MENGEWRMENGEFFQVVKVNSLHNDTLDQRLSILNSQFSIPLLANH